MGSTVVIDEKAEIMGYEFIKSVLGQVEEVTGEDLDNFYKMLVGNITDRGTYNGFLAGLHQHKRQYYFNGQKDPLFKLKKEVLQVFYTELLNFGNYKF